MNELYGKNTMPELDLYVALLSNHGGMERYPVLVHEGRGM